jgi:hypothetical protein
VMRGRGRGGDIMDHFLNKPPFLSILTILNKIMKFMIFSRTIKTH